MPNRLVHMEDLDDGVRECLAERSACRGFEMNVTSTGKRRTGNALLDVLRIHRQTRTSGWAFNGLILFKGDVVVYTLTGGQPRIELVAEETNPLGPLQNAGTQVAAAGAKQAMRGSAAGTPVPAPFDPIPPSAPAAAVTLR